KGRGRHTPSGRNALGARLASRASAANRAFPPRRRSMTARSISCPRSESAVSRSFTNTPKSGFSDPGYICETRRTRNGERSAANDLDDAEAHLVDGPLAPED